MKRPPLNGAATSSSTWEWLRNGDEDVTTPAMDLERGGDVLIAMGDFRVPSIPDPLPSLRRAGIPEGWEPIAPGRAKHAPGERRVVIESAPQRGAKAARASTPFRVKRLTATASLDPSDRARSTHYESITSGNPSRLPSTKTKVSQPKQRKHTTVDFPKKLRCRWAV